MIVITTPTGNVGSLLLDRLVNAEEPLRLVARDASRLDPRVRERVEVVEGSHADPAVLDAALPGADALFWLVPPDFRAPSAMEYYLSFATAATAAIRRHHVGHVVGVSSAGHDWPKPAGLLSAAFAMDAELAQSGAAYRALSMPFYMENFDRNLDAVQHDGVLSLTNEADRPLPLIANRDIAVAAARLLTDREWAGQENVPVFGPDTLTPRQMAEVMGDVVGRHVEYRQTSLGDFAARMAARGASDQAIQDMSEMYVAQNEGLYDTDWATVTPTATDLRTWFSAALAAETGGNNRR